MNSAISHGGIYWVSFSTSVGHEYQGHRPAVVIESDTQLARTNLVTVMPLTSQIRKKHHDDILIKADAINNLYGDSLLKVHHIESFDHSRFIKKIGLIEDHVKTKVCKYLKIHFGI